MENSGAEALELAAWDRAGQHDRVIAGLRDALRNDPMLLADPWVQGWCARRWRNLFLQSAVEDPSAVERATAKLRLGRDNRPPRQRIAERFLRGDALSEWSVEMPPAVALPLPETTMLFCPGLLDGVLPAPAFGDAFARLHADHGWQVLSADSHPMRGCLENMADLDAAVMEGRGRGPDGQPIAAEVAEPPGALFFLAHGKGMADLLTYLVHHPELRGRVRCVVSWGGAVGGSHLADDIQEGIRDLPLESLADRIDDVLHLVAPELRVEGSLRRLDEWDVHAAISDLTTWRRQEFLADHAAEIAALEIPVFSFSGATSLFEVPYFQMRDYLTLAKYDANNDMLLTTDQARLQSPLAMDMAMLHAHHWDLAYDPFPVVHRLGSPNLDHPFPRHAALDALVRFLAELGLLR